MNTLIETPADTDPRLLKASVFSADQIQNDVSPPAVPHPRRKDALQVDEVQSLEDVMEAICDDCCKNSLQYVVRSDTGHDGE